MMKIKIYRLIFWGTISMLLFSHKKSVDLEKQCLKKAEEILADKTVNPFSKIKIKLEIATATLHKEGKLSEKESRETDALMKMLMTGWSEMIYSKMLMESASNLQKAVQTCRQIPNSEARVLAMCDLIGYFARAEDIENAKKLFEEANNHFSLMDPSNERVAQEIQAALFVAQSYINPEEALKFIKESKNPRTRIFALGSGGVSFGKRNKERSRYLFKEAYACIDDLIASEEEKKIWRLSIAFDQSIYDRETAREVFKKGLEEFDTVDADVRIEFLNSLAVLGASLNDHATHKFIEELISSTDSMNTPQKDFIYSTVVSAEAFLGNSKKAVKFLSKIHDPGIRENIVTITVIKLSKQDLKKAYDFISEIPDKSLRALSLAKAVFRQYD